MMLIPMLVFTVIGTYCGIENLHVGACGFFFIYRKCSILPENPLNSPLFYIVKKDEKISEKPIDK